MARKRVVYVSSTFCDLVEHRAALKSALERAQYDVESMEKYPAFDERPLDKCLADVASADAYVLILAYRYGFRPKDGNPDRKSITQLEYEEAGRHSGKPRLVFTVDPEHPWKPKWIDKGKDARDLDAFRATVLDRHGIRQFTDPDQLVGLVLQALRAWESGAGRTESVEPAPSWNWPRPWDFSPYMANKRRDFVGREWLFDLVRTWHAEPNSPQALLLCADFGVGKSAFLAKLVADASVPIIGHHFCHHDTIETLNPMTFVRSVAAQLAAALPDYRAAVEADPEAKRWLDDATRDPASAFERAVVAPLNTIPAPAAPQVLLIDALDEALDFEASTGGNRATNIVRLLAARTQRLPAWVKVLATSRRRQEVLQPMQHAFRPRLLDGEDIRNLNDIRTYVSKRCSSGVLSSVLARGGKHASDLAEFLSSADQSGGKFLYAVRVLDDLESGALPVSRLSDLPPGMDGFYLDAFERRFPTEADSSAIRPLLALLCAEREPLSSSSLAAMLCTPQDQVQRQLARVEDFLNVRGKRYAFDHLSLAQWLTEDNDSGFARAGRFAVDTQSATAQIADWARRELNAGRAYQSDYLARHLGSYLSQKERKLTFAQLLFDFRWLDARLRASGVNALLADWDGLDLSPALEALARALNHAAHVLGHDGTEWHGPDFLAAQILGRLQHRTEPETQRLCAQAVKQIRSQGGLRPLTSSLQSTDALLRTLVGHSGWVRAVAVLADGRIASGSDDQTIKLWNPSSAACEATLEGHNSAVSALAVLVDERLASGSWDGTVKLWNPATGICEATLIEHRSSVNALAVLTDGRLASASDDHTIKLWNPASGACEATLEGHGNSVTALAVLTDGRLASASRDSTIKLWNPVSGACEATFDTLEDLVTALAALADGRIASGSRHRKVKLFNLSSGVCETSLAGHRNSVRALEMLADGRLASASWDHTIKLWNLVSGACEATLEGHADAVEAVAELADRRLASGSWDNTVKLWNAASGNWNAALERHSSSVTALTVLADGRFASCSDDSTIKVWNMASGACEATFEGDYVSVAALAVLADGRLASGSMDDTIKLWNPASGACEATLEGHQDSVTALAVLVDGRLASGSDDRTVKFWNPVTGVCEATLEGHTDSVLALRVLADGRLASGSADCAVRLWNPVSGACDQVLQGHLGSVTSLAVLTDGRLASGSWDNTIKLWNPLSGACEATLEGHTDSVLALEVLPDGRLASGSEEKSIRIWQLHDDRSTGSVQFLMDSGVSALVVSPAGLVLAVGDKNGRVHFLKIEDSPTVSSNQPDLPE